jgi:phenylpyruvate tautomerase PptA (4-oxalocrotonate tautomerase family)
MDVINKSNADVGSNSGVELPDSSGRLSRRAVLASATVGAAATAAGVSAGLADTADAGFGAPLVELNVLPAVLTAEQKGALIKGITEVLVSTMKLAPDQTRKIFVQLIETAEGGFGVGGQAFVPRGK